MKLRLFVEHSKCDKKRGVFVSILFVRIFHGFHRFFSNLFQEFHRFLSGLKRKQTPPHPSFGSRNDIHVVFPTPVSPNTKMFNSSYGFIVFSTPVNLSRGNKNQALVWFESL